MGTTADKLNYLKETKNEIKNVLETPYNVFRDYPSLIKKYIDNQPTKTVNDGVCGNAVDVPIVRLGIDGNSEQKSYGGKNKLDFKKILENAGATYTEQDEVFNLTDQGKLYSAPYKLNLKPNTTYTIYQNFQEQNSTNVRLAIVQNSDYKIVVESYSNRENEANRKKTFTTDENSDYYIRGDWSVLKSPLIYNEPILVEGTDVTSYEPYTGGVPSPNPEYPQEIEAIDNGWNLFDGEIELGWIDRETGELLSDNSKTRSKNFMSVRPNTSYTLTRTDGIYRWVLGYTKDKVGITDGNWQGTKSGLKSTPDKSVKTITFTTSPTTYYIKWYDSSCANLSEQVMITEGTSLKPYLPHGSIGLEQSGKNYLNLDRNLTFTRFLQLAVNIPAGTYHLTNTSLSSSDGSYDIKIAFKDNNTSNWLYNNRDRTITLSKDETIVYLYAKGSFASSEGITSIITDFMLSKDGGIYEPYHSPKLYPINLNGNSIAKVGDIKDILKVNRNGEVEIKKNIGKVILDGSERLGLVYSKIYNNMCLYDTSIVSSVINKNGKLCSNNFTYSSIFNEYVGEVIALRGNKAIGIALNSSRCPNYTTAEVKTWLSQHPTEVYYELAEPQTIKLPSISPIELWQGTNIFKLITNLETNFEVEYVADKDSILKEVQTAMLEAEVEI